PVRDAVPAGLRRSALHGVRVRSRRRQTLASGDGVRPGALDPLGPQRPAARGHPDVHAARRGGRLAHRRDPLYALIAAALVIEGGLAALSVARVERDTRERVEAALVARLQL